MNLIYKYLVVVMMAAITVSSCAQTAPATHPNITNPDLDKRLTNLLRFDVPLIGADSLAGLEDVTIFDTREQEEYAVSHLANAVQLSPKGDIPEWILNMDHDQPIVLYCSVGYRSENVGRKLKKEGFTNVYNLYGSIFDWVEKGYPIEDEMGEPTEVVHTYNQRWGKLLNRPADDKIW